MGLRTVEEYKAGLRDGREVYYRGQLVTDVTSHPVTSIAVKHACIDFQMAEDPRYRDLAVVSDPETGESYSRYFHVPRNAEDLLLRSRLISASTREGATLVVLIKEIGSDALLALRLVTEELAGRGKPEYRERLENFYQTCRDRDYALAVAQSDVKGDRSLGPRDQAHPDYYLRIVERRSDGIVVRGAKVHTSVSPNSDEIIVIPTRAMGPDDKDYSVTFAVPVATPGLKLLVSCYGGTRKNSFEFPISANHKMMETLTVFDDVFVPWERVFLCGETEAAGLLALTFVRFHRFTAVSYKLPLLELLAGAGRAMAGYNGVERAGHIREKLTKLASYHATVEGLVLAAIQMHKVVPPGVAVPNTLMTNVAKYQFASNYHQAVQMVQDISGGLLVTGPSLEDWEGDQTGPLINKYLGGRKGVPTEDRIRMLNLISDLTAGDFGGYQEVLAVHAEGSLEAEKIQTYREYDFASAAAYARQLAGIRSTSPE